MTEQPFKKWAEPIFMLILCSPYVVAIVIKAWGVILEALSYLNITYISSHDDLHIWGFIYTWALFSNSPVQFN